MSKQAIIEKMIGTGMTAAEAERQFEAVFDGLKAALRDPAVESVQIRQFGTFEKRFMKDRVSQNPRTREPIHIPGHQALRFKASKKFTF